MTLEELREQIDVLDRQLVELLSERARAAQMIGHLKAATSLPVYEPAREKVIYANVRAANKGPLPDIELTHIYERIIDVMRALQRNELASERNAQAACARATALALRQTRPRQGTSNDRMPCRRKPPKNRSMPSSTRWRKPGSTCIAPRARSQTILAGVGPTASLDLSKFEVLPGVLHVHRISSPYKLAGRAFRPEGTVVEFPNGAKIGGEQVAVIAGPCAIENREQIFAIAALREGRGRQAFCAEAPSSRAARLTPFRAWAFPASN